MLINVVIIIINILLLASSSLSDHRYHHHHHHHHHHYFQSIQFRNWNCLFKKNGIEVDKFRIGIEVCYKNPQINLPQKLFNSEIFLP